MFISLGDDGDRFYVIEQGHFDVFKDQFDGSGPQHMTILGPGCIFGELALMYNMPRAATVRTTAGKGPHVCWATDRSTFRHILMRCFMEQREKFEGFLDKVDLFRGIFVANISMVVNYCRSYATV